MASGSNGFRAKVFDPLLIVSQIIALQVFFYVSLGLWIIFADVIARLTPSFDQLFSYKVSEWVFMGYIYLWDYIRPLSLSIIYRSLSFPIEVGLWWEPRHSIRSLGKYTIMYWCTCTSTLYMYMYSITCICTFVAIDITPLSLPLYRLLFGYFSIYSQ